jgi:Tol biopolymer transport system component
MDVGPAGLGEGSTRWGRRSTDFDLPITLAQPLIILPQIRRSLTRLLGALRPSIQPGRPQGAVRTSRVAVSLLGLLGLGALLMGLITSGLPLNSGRIAFTGTGWLQDSDIYAVNVDGSGLVRLTENPDSDSDPSWSPDGKQLVFVSERHSQVDLYKMQADGSDPLPLTQDAALDLFPAWSPEGRRIAFMSDRTGGYELYTINTDGGDRQQLTRNTAHDVAPAWSPDGQQLAFVSDRDGNYEIYVMQADGTHPRRLTHDPAVDTAPAWSPDGRTIAFVSGRGNPQGNSSLYVMQADGTRPRRLGEGALNEVTPAWSPTGQMVGVAASPIGASGIAPSSAPGQGFELRLLRADGQESTPIRLERALMAMSPAWQPRPSPMDKNGLVK